MSKKDKVRINLIKAERLSVRAFVFLCNFTKEKFCSSITCRRKKMLTYHDYRDFNRILEILRESSQLIQLVPKGPKLRQSLSTLMYLH